jgi:membrane protein implicated in regulation of membrane protease activity
VKQFWIYTGLRLLFFVAAAIVVGGIWLAIAGTAPVMWVLIIALVISGLASYFLLGRQRAALAQHVDARARRASEKFEEMRTKEDVD